MAIGKRIFWFRYKQGLKQKEFGQLLGFSAATSEARITQYEKEARTPKTELIDKMAAIFHIRPEALKVPDIDTVVGLMHTMFALEDWYAVRPQIVDGAVYLRFDPPEPGKTSLYDYALVWGQEYEKWQKGEITKEEYDHWRYNFPDTDEENLWVKIPPDFKNKKIP